MPKPKGKAIDWSDAQIERDATLTEEDVQLAQELAEEVDTVLAGMLIAESEDGTSEA